MAASQTEPAPTALVSLHDVMPETFAAVEATMQRLQLLGVSPVTLLVVPGRSWSEVQLQRLRDWAGQGHELAAHGWQHEATRVRGLQHRLHALLLSRNTAEHLALGPQEILSLMLSASAWFAARALPPPSLYVPPAWALGPLTTQGRAQLPYRQIEVLSGLHELPGRGLRRLPLLGFEADTVPRAGFLRVWNAVQLRLAPWLRRPLRISIHPHDFELRLGASLDRLLQRRFRYRAYRELPPAAAPAT